MSGSEQLKVATAIIRCLKPECGFVLVDKLEQMDTVTLSESMNVAFDTTIAGVISAAVASVISHIRKRWYNDDMVSLETLMEAVLEEVTSDVEG